MEGRPVEDKGRGKAIFLMDYDGAQARPYTFNRSINIGAAWGPDGRSLSWASFSSGYPDIYLSLLDGRPATRPAHGTDVFQKPESGDFARRHEDRVYVQSRRLRVFRHLGRRSRRFQPAKPNAGTPKSSEGAATWSPNGAQIAFTSDRVGPPQIYMMNADGTGVTRVPCGPKCDRPAWSALGYIAYTLERPGGKDIAITDLSKMEPRIITDGNGANEQPTVSSNGRHIAFVTSRWGNRQIASIDYDGQNIRQLTNTGVNTYPNWSPASGGR
jgi:TolB protein